MKEQVCYLCCRRVLNAHISPGSLQSKKTVHHNEVYCPDFVPRGALDKSNISLKKKCKYYKMCRVVFQVQKVFCYYMYQALVH